MFVTHDQEEALALSDRIAVMSKGVVKQVDTAEGLYEAPNSRAVAAFIGSMNFLQGTVSGKEGVLTRVSAGPLGHFSRAPARSQPVNPCRLRSAPKRSCFTVRNGSPSIRSVDRSQPRPTWGTAATTSLRSDGLTTPFIVASQNTLRGKQAPVVGEIAWLSWLPEASIVLAD